MRREQCLPIGPLYDKEGRVAGYKEGRAAIAILIVHEERAKFVG